MPGSPPSLALYGIVLYCGMLKIDYGMWLLVLRYAALLTAGCNFIDCGTKLQSGVSPLIW